jgi:hypothetical protein
MQLWFSTQSFDYFKNHCFWYYFEKLKCFVNKMYRIMINLVLVYKLQYSNFLKISIMILFYKANLARALVLE